MMDGLTESQLDRLRSHLRILQGELERRLEQAVNESRPVGVDQPIGRLTRVDAMQQQQMAAGQERRLERELQQVVAALGRLDTIAVRRLSPWQEWDRVRTPEDSTGDDPVLRMPNRS